uniref:Doubled CXXCH motif n=1 Tax=Gimesia panareensis TaxID=2527978 RepID=A0A517Q3W5_9PLAN|nr:cytochrome c3 family protein [Gimesia panareensis]QDT26314.1 Doubled CXXCH motif [Gimesia panareensis]
MTEPLQSFNWKDSNYERPGNDWVCGRMCELGQCCRLGPDSQGGCQVQSRCQPEKKGEKYVCTRSAVHGGKCKEGPTEEGMCCQADTSCQPHRSLAAKRRLLSCIATAAGVLFCLFLFGGSSPTPRLAPGDVTAAHAAIESDCQACHASAEGGLGHWMHTAFDSEGALKDSARCLRCHKELGENALFAHSLSADRLSEKTRQIQETVPPTATPFALELAAFTDPQSAKDQLTCATCHQEHHGRKAILTQLTDMQCQNCHVRQFNSFEHGHPGLGDYPYERRSRIYFDHNTHLNRYFVEDEFKRTMPGGIKPKSCQTCHTADASGRFMLTGTFEQTCSSCHESQIQDSEFPGVPFFALPVIPPAGKSDSVQWPRTTGVFETARLPRMMELLLSEDPDYQQAVQELGEIDYRRLDQLNESEQQALAQVGRAIRKLLYEVSIQGESALEQRLGKAGSAYLQMKPSIVPTLKQAQLLWFPDLISEMEQSKTAQKQATPAPTESQQKKQHFLPDSSGGWSISNSDFAIRYRPLGHADPLIKAWLDQAVQKDPRVLAQDQLWQIFSSPTASGTEATPGALASGRCLMCHTVDRNSQNGTARINWQPLKLTSAGEHFTRFSHRPHLAFGGRQNCETCHTLDPSGTDLTTVLQKHFFERDANNIFWKINDDPDQVCTSGFQPVNRQSCVTCHNRTTKTQSCLQCHQYHAHARVVEK